MRGENPARESIERRGSHERRLRSEAKITDQRSTLKAKGIAIELETREETREKTKKPLRFVTEEREMCD